MEVLLVCLLVCLLFFSSFLCRCYCFYFPTCFLIFRPYPKGSMRDDRINKQSSLPIGGDHDQGDVSYAVVFFFALLYPTLWSEKAKA
jgi:hypothetical protein